MESSDIFRPSRSSKLNFIPNSSRNSSSTNRFPLPEDTEDDDDNWENGFNLGPAGNDAFRFSVPSSRASGSSRGTRGASSGTEAHLRDFAELDEFDELQDLATIGPRPNLQWDSIPEDSAATLTRNVSPRRHTQAEMDRLAAQMEQATLQVSPRRSARSVRPALSAFADSDTPEDGFDFSEPIDFPAKLQTRKTAPQKFSEPRSAFFAPTLDELQDIRDLRDLRDLSSPAMSSRGSVSSIDSFCEDAETDSTELLSGIELPESPVDFRSALAERAKQAAQMAQAEHKNQQIGGRSAVISAFQESAYDEDGDVTFLDGFELGNAGSGGAGRATGSETLRKSVASSAGYPRQLPDLHTLRNIHRNVVVKSHNAGSSKLGPDGFLATPSRQRPTGGVPSSPSRPTRLPRPVQSSVNLRSSVGSFFDAPSAFAAPKTPPEPLSVPKSPQKSVKSASPQRKLRKAVSSFDLGHGASRRSSQPSVNYNTLVSSEKKRQLLDILARQPQGTMRTLRGAAGSGAAARADVAALFDGYEADVDNDAEKLTADLDSVDANTLIGSLRRRPMAQPRVARVYGDGTELDGIGDLSDDGGDVAEEDWNRTIDAKTIKAMRSGKSANVASRMDYLDLFREPSKSKPLTARKAKHKHRSGKRPKVGLIKQFSVPKKPLIDGYEGNMRFNPEKLIWEGNETELHKFDTIGTGKNGSLRQKHPGLIAFMSHKGVQVVGQMVFDPSTLSWVNLNAQEDENDPFREIEMEEREAEARKQKENPRGDSGNEAEAPGLRAVSTTTASSWSDAASVPTRVGSGVGGSAELGNQIGKEFSLSEDYVASLLQEESRWARKVRNWFPPSEPFDRSYCYEIRNMVMGHKQ